MPEISTILSLVSALVLVFVLSWWFNRSRQTSESFRVIDTALMSLAAFFVIARVLGLVYFREGLPVDWSFLPVTQPETEVLYLETWPWLFFRISDGKFLFVEFVSAIFVVEVILRQLFERRLGLKNLLWSQNMAAGIYAVALVPFLITAYFNGYLAEDMRVPYTLMLATLAGLTALVLTSINRDSVLVKLTLLLDQIVAVLAFNFIYEGEVELLPVNLFMIGLILLNGLYTLIDVANLRRVTKQAETRRPNRMRADAVRRGVEYGY